MFLQRLGIFIPVFIQACSCPFVNVPLHIEIVNKCQIYPRRVSLLKLID